MPSGGVHPIINLPGAPRVCYGSIATKFRSAAMCQTVTLQCYSVGTNEGRRLGTWRFASMAMQELECGLAEGPRRLQTKGMRGVGKDDLLHVREIAR
jgi:hypothetical protein